MNSYLRGLVKRAEIEKSAKNILRLLSRVGPDLAGATSRDLKFLNRRGLRGFNPRTVASMRAKGFLPSVDAELAGFNRGTENMLSWTLPPKEAPPSRTTSPEYYEWQRRNAFAFPAKITRTNEPGAKHHYDPNYPRSVVIPDAYAPGTLAEREMRASGARHEAREGVRSNAAEFRGRSIALPGRLAVSILSSPEVGTTHAPGVIYDERIFRSQLANRLGLGQKWSDLPLDYDKHGRVLTRGARDTYTGNKPLGYEFDMVNQWRRLNNEQASLVKPMLAGIESSRSSGAVRDYINDLAGNTVAALELERGRIPGVTQSSVAKYLSNRLKQRGDRYFDIKDMVAKDVVEGIGTDVERMYRAPISRISGIPVDDLRSVADGFHTVVPEGSELHRLRQLSAWPRVNGKEYDPIASLFRVSFS